jgi:hypothetical protein
LYYPEPFTLITSNSLANLVIDYDPAFSLCGPFSLPLAVPGHVEVQRPGQK